MFTFVGSALGNSSIMVNSAELLDGHFGKNLKDKNLKHMLIPQQVFFVFFGDHNDV